MIFFARILTIWLVCLVGLPAFAQVPDTLTLRDALARTAAHDPRLAQQALQETMTRLRLDDLRAGWRPRLVFGADASYQSEVASLPISVPGLEMPTPPRLHAQVTVEAEQLLYDGGRLAQQAAVAQARLVETHAELVVTRYALQSAVLEAFFNARLVQEHIALLDLQRADLDARLAFVTTQQRHGAALPADVAALEAEHLRLQQQRAELVADEQALRAVLSELTGQPIPADVVFMETVPEPVLNVDELPEERPEFALFDRRRERLAEEKGLAALQRRPQVAAFGRAGIGRPGFDFFEPQVHPFGLVGLRVRWHPLDWGAARRQEETLAIQQQILDTEAAAFSQRLLREIQREAHDLPRLEQTLAADSAIIARREVVERTARRQLEEGVLLAAEYTQRLNDLYAARRALSLHRLQHAHTRARLLLTLGLL